MSSASVRFGTKAYVCARYFQTGEMLQIHRPARRGRHRTRLRGHSTISVLCVIKRYQKWGQDLSGVQHFESDVERK